MNKRKQTAMVLFHPLPCILCIHNSLRRPLATSPVPCRLLSAILFVVYLFSYPYLLLSATLVTWQLSTKTRFE